MASDRGRKQTTSRAGEARQKSRWIPPGIQESKREGQEDEERGKTNVVDVVEDKERWTQPTLTTPGPLLRDAQSPPGHGRHRAACTQSERLLVTETLRQRPTTAASLSFSFSAMTSYFSSLLWGTSQLDDAIGTLLLIPVVDVFVHPLRRQGDV